MEEENNHDKVIVVEVGDDEGLNIDSEMLETTKGLEFDLLDAIKSFYGTYASKKSFGWKIRDSKKGLDRELHYLVLACTREGSCVSKIPPTLKILPGNVAKCYAKVRATKRQDGVWCINKIVLEHSHDVSSRKARKLRVNKNISLHIQRTIQMNDDAGVRINKIFQSLAQGADGYENLPFGEWDVRNYV